MSPISVAARRITSSGLLQKLVAAHEEGHQPRVGNKEPYRPCHNRVMGCGHDLSVGRHPNDSGKQSASAARRHVDFGEISRQD